MTSTVVKPSQSTYTFSSQPRVVQQKPNPIQRPKFRQQQGKNVADENPSIGNLMFDRRVVRGNTYALHTLPANVQPDPVEFQRQEEAKRRALARRRLRDQMRVRTPEPVAGRKNIDVQTELYLEELSDRIEEADVDVQTDAFLDRPVSPLFIPTSTGKTVATQIGENDLFDFDLEAKPIVETLVGKTVEQALLEVAEEEELATIRDQQRRFEELRNAELIEIQRLEEQERRLRAEKDRRIAQEDEARREESDMAEKVAARAFARSYLQDLIPAVFKNLRENGFFYDPVENEVETSFMPWLIDATLQQINRLVLGRTILDAIIRDVVQRRTADFEQLEEILRQAAERGRETEMSAVEILYRYDANVEGTGSALGGEFPLHENSFPDGTVPADDELVPTRDEDGINDDEAEEVE